MSKTLPKLGYTACERAESPYACFFNPELAPLPEHVREALLVGGVACDLMPTVRHAAALHEPGYWPVETGYTLSPDGAARIAVLTRMPRVTPAMWDWWFAWHGSEGLRYKLWHPQAHLDVGWTDDRSDLAHYVGRTSRVTEFVGSQRMRLDIRFVPPSSLGFDEPRLAAQGEVAICARISFAGLPLETAWLVHHIRPVSGGSEMRTRIWLGGDNAGLRGLPQSIGRAAGWLAKWLRPITAAQVHELIVHDAHEMNHLAGFLPELHAAFGPDAVRQAA